MNSSLERQDYIIQIRDKLRKDGIKLWLPPFFNESSTSASDLKNLSQDYSGLLKIPFEVCYDTLKELQSNSLENLKQKNLFQKSGLATLKIKILHQHSPPTILTKELVLSMRTCDLKNIIKQDVNIAIDQFKLISAGKVLVDSDSLGSQEIVENENQIKEMENVKTDSRLLALDNEYMQLEDQFGNPIQIPSHEKKALIVAMALHEKGKSRVQTVQFPTSQNSYERLKRCEEKFHSTYGPNLERLIAVKGTPGNEEALFMRLHLLQAIVLYHQNKRSEALTLLQKVENEIKNLKVDEESLIVLVELGYTMAEATIGLRATKGDVNQAANYINENREKRAESRKKAQAQAIYEKEKKILGLCDDGKQHVDPNFVKILVNMGYNREAARLALKKTNNIISDGIQYMQENPLPGSSRSRSAELMSLIDDLTKELQDAGFDMRMARLALEKHSGDIMKAAEELIANDGIVLGNLSSIVGPESIEDIKKKRLELEEKNEAYKRLKEDIETVDDDHLDINLLQEERFLQEYLSLLKK
ncbi:hypothetical protein JTB14_020976 [Gonioctena quinquepunctata]|nr:hypothetical protein JTB14_020976 [Gonioctena quinquepunctata]